MPGPRADQYFGSDTRRGGRGRARPSAAEPRHETNRVPHHGWRCRFSVVVREWSSRDVWHRNRECDRGIKSRQVSVHVRVQSTLSRSSVSRARVPSGCRGRGRKKEGARRRKIPSTGPVSRPNVPSPLARLEIGATHRSCTYFIIYCTKDYKP